MATYYVRADGIVTAANKATATDPTSASTSLSLAEASASSFSPGDQVVFSSRGGNFSSGYFEVPSSGATDRPIIYKGEYGYTPVFSDASRSYHFNAISKHDFEFQNMKSIGPTNSCFRIIGNSYRVVGRDLIGMRSGNQAFQHEENSGFSPVVEYHNIVGCYCTDDGLSLHDDSRVTVYGGRFFRNDQGINYIAGGHVTLYDVTSIGNTAYDFWLTQQTGGSGVRATRCRFGGRVSIDNSAASGDYMKEVYFDSCYFGGNAGAYQSADIGGGTADKAISPVLLNCVFEGSDSTKYALALRGSTVSANYTVENCSIVSRVKLGNGLFVGPDVTARIRNLVIYNQVTGWFGYSSNTFDVKGLAMYGNTNNFSAVAGWNPTVDISADPKFTEQLKGVIRTKGCSWVPQSTSPLIGAGSSDLAYANEDFYGKQLRGTIGAIS